MIGWHSRAQGNCSDPENAIETTVSLRDRVWSSRPVREGLASRFFTLLLSSSLLFMTIGCDNSPLQMIVCELTVGTYTCDEDVGRCECVPDAHRAKTSSLSSGAPLYVAASAHLAGQNGTNWRSDAEIHNLGDESAVVTIELLLHGADNSNPSSTAVNLAPGESRRLNDVLASEFGISGKAALRFLTDSSTVFITSRTYNLLGDGNSLELPSGSTFGQYIPALEPDAAIRFGEEGRLIQLSQDPPSSGFRTNLVLVNARSFGVDVETELFSAGGTRLGIVRTRLAPFEYRQADRVFTQVTSQAVTDGYAVVRTTTQDGAFFALASVVDNLTGDPVAVTATPMKPGRGASSSPLYLVASAHLAGSAGTNWRTDVEVHNRGETAVTFSIELLEHGLENTSPRMQSFTLEPGRSRRFVDVLADVFSFNGKAALRITPTNGAILVSSRTYNLLGAGNRLGLPDGATFGQNIPAVGLGQAIRTGDEGRLIQLSHDPSGTSGFRTNLAFVNAGAQQVIVEAELHRADGTTLGTVTRPLKAYEYLQVDKIYQQVTGEVIGDGYAIVRATSADGAFFALASVVDNLTGDPVGMIAPIIRSPAGNTLAGGIEGIYEVLELTSIPEAVTVLQQTGVDGMLSNIANLAPSLATVTPTSLVIDYGEGWTDIDGTLRSGSVEVDASQLTIDGDGITGSVVQRQPTLRIDGEAPAAERITWTFDLVEAGDRVSGDVEIDSGSAARAAGATAAKPISGRVGIDTAICLTYPVSGSIDLVHEGEEITVTFGPECNGIVVYTVTEAPATSEVAGEYSGTLQVTESPCEAWLTGATYNEWFRVTGSDDDLYVEICSQLPPWDVVCSGEVLSAGPLVDGSAILEAHNERDAGGGCVEVTDERHTLNFSDAHLGGNIEITVSWLANIASCNAQHTAHYPCVTRGVLNLPRCEGCWPGG